jgi:hypothetical protein
MNTQYLFNEPFEERVLGLIVHKDEYLFCQGPQYKWRIDSDVSFSEFVGRFDKTFSIEAFSQLTHKELLTYVIYFDQKIFIDGWTETGNLISDTLPLGWELIYSKAYYWIPTKIRQLWLSIDYGSALKSEQKSWFLHRPSLVGILKKDSDIVIAREIDAIWEMDREFDRYRKLNEEFYNITEDNMSNYIKQLERNAISPDLIQQLSYSCTESLFKPRPVFFVDFNEKRLVNSRYDGYFVPFMLEHKPVMPAGWTYELVPAENYREYVPVEIKYLW